MAFVLADGVWVKAQEGCQLPDSQQLVIPRDKSAWLSFLRKRYTGEKWAILRVFLRPLKKPGGPMTKRYESLSEVLNVLRKRRIQASLEEVESVLRRLGLREPFGPEDVAELVTHLQPQHTVSRRIMKTARVLSSREWADAVLAVRLELGLPSTGLSEEAARKLHKALLDTLVGELPTLVKIGARDWQPVHLVWRDLVAA
jgi:hypothetical protein